MHRSTAISRSLFIFLSLLVTTLYLTQTHSAFSLGTLFYSLFLGMGLGSLILAFEHLFKKFEVQTLCYSLIGFIAGSLFSLYLMKITLPNFTSFFSTLPLIVTDSFKLFFILSCSLLGMLLTKGCGLLLADFFSAKEQKKYKLKEVLLDISALKDPRLIDFANSGLLDERLVIPRFLLKELYAMEEEEDEIAKQKAKKMLEVIKKLEMLPELSLVYRDDDFPGIKDISLKMVHLAKCLQAKILLSDFLKPHKIPSEEIRIVNINALSKSLKPLMERGEFLKIKVLRHGKEERQGVGYLDDGTMVVVNGGGDYLGEVVKARVLSVKHSTSGRMIFCNITDDDFEDEDEEMYYEDEEEDCLR